jgi:hypothetical protein
MSDRAIWASPSNVTFPMRASTILQLLAMCDSTHPNCQAYLPQNTSGPARLIDVGSEGEPPKLCLMSEFHVSGLEARYLALSHCWGGDGPLKTTSSTLADFRVSMPLAQLPRTYQEAIAATRALGVRFLWIDSLCIVQDDPDDWAHEAAKMASVFQYAYLTISAVSAKDSQGSLGIFAAHPPALQFGLPYSNESPKAYPEIPRAGTCSRIFLDFQGSTWYRNRDILFHSPLKNRGWIFQEMMLSRRILHLADGQFLWECHSLLESEDGTYNGVIDNIYPWQRSEEHLKLVSRLRNEGESRRIWWKWMNEYWKREFTYSSDSLPAIAGITHLYQELTGDTPVVGLWKGGLPFDLAWYTCPRSTTLMRESGMPSWSWVSISHPFRRHISHYYEGYKGADCGTVFWQAQVAEIDIQWTERPLISPLRQAMICLKGSIRREDLQRDGPYFQSYRSISGRWMVFFDMELDLPPSITVDLILLSPRLSENATILSWHTKSPPRSH